MALKIPLSLASKKDITHVHRELRNFTDKIIQKSLQHSDQAKYPAITDMLRDLAKENKIDLRDDKACLKLLEELDKLSNNAPVLHISFPSEPSVDELQKLIRWFREEIDPNIFIQVGLQPTIAVGIVLRTPNRQFDFSLRQHLYNNKYKLAEALKV